MSESATTLSHPGISDDQFGPISLLKPVTAVDTEMEDVGQPIFDHDVVMSPQQTSVEQPLLPLVEQARAKMTCLQLKSKIEEACKLNFIEIFSSNDGEKAFVDPRAFLLYHPTEHSEELDLIMRWLLMHHVEVGNVWYDGSWNNFKRQILGGGSGVVIVCHQFFLKSEHTDFVGTP